MRMSPLGPPSASVVVKWSLVSAVAQQYEKPMPLVARLGSLSSGTDFRRLIEPVSTIDPLT